MIHSHRKFSVRPNIRCWYGTCECQRLSSLDDSWVSATSLRSLRTSGSFPRGALAPRARLVLLRFGFRGSAYRHHVQFSPGCLNHEHKGKRLHHCSHSWAQTNSDATFSCVAVFSYSGLVAQGMIHGRTTCMIAHHNLSATCCDEPERQLKGRIPTQGKHCRSGTVQNHSKSQ